MATSLEPAKPRSHRLFNGCVIVAAIVLILAVAIIINSRHADNSVTMVADALDVDNDDMKIDWGRYSTTDLHLTKTTTITKAGTYHVTGDLADGSLVIDVGDAVVKLVLDNVSINNTSGPAIYCQSADDLVIELQGDNTLSDGETYAKDYDAKVTGALFSKADLTFTGSGTLNIAAHYADGIVSKDDLKFRGGNFIITAPDDAVRGTDSVYIASGDFTLDATENAIKSTNEVDAKKGFVLIENGNFTITAHNKGLKAVNAILIQGGNFVLTAYDDAIHSDNFVGITSGTLNLSSGDDAIHANNELLIEGGDINVVKSYEGFEAQVITINAGKVQIAASDDGINAGGGNNSTTPQKDIFNVDENCTLTINGGDIYINASGDGVDSNGWLYFNDGNVIVDGPTNNGNGALDAGAGIIMNGGTVIAVGASGMAESLGSNSSVFNISIYFDTVYPANTELKIANSQGEIILSHTSAKTFNHASLGSQQFHLGETYTIYLDSTEYRKFTITEITTFVGQARNNFAF